MKRDSIYNIYSSVGIKFSDTNINKDVKAVIVNFDDSRGDIIVTNDNYNTRRKYPDFTEGKKKAGLHPLQIVFTSIESARLSGDRYINANNEIVNF